MTMNRRFLLGTAASTLATMTATPLTSALAKRPRARPLPSQRLDYVSVSELRALLDARKISATEPFEHAVGRIELLDSRINAVVVRDFERARAAAREADAALARGERRPLLGIPMTVKEAFNVEGLPTTWGLPMGRDWRAAEDAVAVARLKAAGAVILGRPISPSLSPTGKASIRSTERPTILGTSRARPAAHPADRRPRWRPDMCRWSSAPISAARCGCRHICAASSATSRRPIWFRSAVRRHPVHLHWQPISRAD